VSAVVTTGGEGAVRIPIDVLDGDTQMMAVVQAESPQRSVFASLDTPAASPAWVADAQATTLATNAGFVSSVSVLGYPMLLGDLPLEPGRWWLTEFEDRWPYASAPGDLWFSPAPHNRRIKRHTPPPAFDLALPAAALATGALRLRRSTRRPR
jgi:hypothetical protein